MYSPLSPTDINNPYASYSPAYGYPAQNNTYPQATTAYPQMPAVPSQQTYPSSYPATDYYGANQAQSPALYNLPNYNNPAYNTVSSPSQQYYGQPQSQAATIQTGYPMDPAMMQSYNSTATNYGPQSQNQPFSLPVLSPSSPSMDKYISSVATPAPAPMEAPPVVESPTTSNPSPVNTQEPGAKQKPTKSIFPRLVGVGALLAAGYVGWRYLFKGDGNNADDVKGENMLTEPLKNFIQEKIKGTNVTEQDYNQLIANLKDVNKKLSADDQIPHGNFTEEVGRALDNMASQGEDDGLKAKAEQLRNIQAKLEESATQSPQADETIEAATKTNVDKSTPEVAEVESKATEDKKNSPTETAKVTS